MKIYRTSPWTGEVNVMDLPVTEVQFLAWESGEMVQDAFPNLTPAEREFLMTGYTPEDWEEMFGDGEGEEPEDEEPWDGFNSDAEADADVLASAGMGTDEDYGYYHDELERDYDEPYYGE